MPPEPPERSSAPDPAHLAGCDLLHILHVRSEPEVGDLQDVLARVGAASARVTALSANLVEGRMQQSLRLSGIDGARARALCDELGRLTGVRHAMVEHLLVARRPAA